MVTQLRPETRLVQGGNTHEKTTGLVNMPVHRGSTVLFETMSALEAAKGQRFKKGTLFYGRFGTPDTFAFEDAMADLDGAFGAIATPSGLAACVLPLFAFLGRGDHAIVADTVYEPVRATVEQYFRRMGVEVDFCNLRDLGSLEAELRKHTKIVYLESPGSLTMEILDLPAISTLSHSVGACVVVDNSWATPLFYQPLKFGADIVAYAGTKYIGGHSDVMIGIVSAKEAHYEPLRRASNWLGYHVSPDDIFLAQRGLRTLGVRMRQHEIGAQAIAAFLASHRAVKRVLHPNHTDCIGHDIWARDFNGASGVFSIVLNTPDPKEAARFVEGLRLFRIGFSWGGFESLALVADPTHARSVTPWNEAGILVRLQIGLEDPRDLIADLRVGLDLIPTAGSAPRDSP